MESYKHSCPMCGQHVEYTAGYCGTQMKCPICGNSIVFPAIPPKKGGTKIEVEEQKPTAQFAWNPKAIFVYLREFEHWKIVGLVLTPFLIIGALLEGASLVKKYSSDQPAAPTAPVVQAQPGGWDRMTQLARSEQKIQECMQNIARAHQALLYAEAQNRQAETEAANARDSHEHEIANDHIRRASFAVSEANKQIQFLRNAFQKEFANYQSLGGTVDYQSKLPN